MKGYPKHSNVLQVGVGWGLFSSLPHCDKDSHSYGRFCNTSDMGARWGVGGGRSGVAPMLCQLLFLAPSAEKDCWWEGLQKSWS